MGFKKDESLYVSGLVKMASTGSKNLGLSYVDAYCFDKKDYLKEFSSFFEIEEIELEKSNLTDKELFNNLFDDNKKTDSLVHWLNILDGNCNEIKILKEEYFSKAIESLSNYSGGLTMFYNVEDVYFLEYKSLTIVLIIGNDE